MSNKPSPAPAPKFNSVVRVHNTLHGVAYLRDGKWHIHIASGPESALQFANIMRNKNNLAVRNIQVVQLLDYELGP